MEMQLQRALPAKIHLILGGIQSIIYSVDKMDILALRVFQKNGFNFSVFNHTNFYLSDYFP